ncbi:MAG: response regulator [bacterium]
MSKKILIVDDEEDVLIFFNALFKDNGFDVIEAKNGLEAYKKAKDDKPDLITLDITMPEESGVRCYKDLRENESTKNIPIIIVSGVDPEFKKFISSRKNLVPPTAYFEKPVNGDELVNKIREILD